jgi:hypothetical protein
MDLFIGSFLLRDSMRGFSCIGGFCLFAKALWRLTKLSEAIEAPPDGIFRFT